ncbi:MAG: NAD-dependent epimerase/dehydratase family protein [Candidatus Pacearchaeota archaeon]|nr:NAD-dependent epimerase/dehydratase family protein [Candidatus Pacearchaeota archaeon]
MRFIMTGHKGLIGTALLKRLKDEGREPVLLIDQRNGDNILDIEDFELDEPVDMMIHLASFCKIQKCIDNPQVPFDVNVLGMHKIMEFCRKNKIPKIVFTSSSRVLSPDKNPYTASKLYGEELVKGYCQAYGIDYVIIRPSTVYGPFNDETTRLMDIFILEALQGKELRITRKPGSTLDFTYIDDFIDGIMLAIKQKNKEFDISYGKGVSVEEVAKYIISLAGKGSWRFDEIEIAQPQEVQLDISAMREIGYNPKIDVFEGIRRTFEWYKENLDDILKSR